MAILVDYELEQWASYGGLFPFSKDMINPASVDLRLGDEWIDIATMEKFTAEELKLYPRDMLTQLYNTFFPWINGRKVYAVLATTLETVTLQSDMAAEIKLKSTPSRKGLAHIVADWVDPGFTGQLTMAIHTFKPVVLRHEMPIVQLVVHKFEEGNYPVHPYGIKGHYMGQEGPTGPWDEQKRRRT